MSARTNRSRSGADARLSLEDYERLYERSAIGVFRSIPEGRYTAVNPAGVRMHGYESEDELLRAVRDIATEIYVRPEDRATLRAFLEDRGEVLGFECELYRHKTGERFWARQNLWRIMGEDGRLRFFEGHVEDITERKRADEEQIGRIEARLLDAVESIPDGFSLFDAEDRLLLCNQRYREIYRLHTDALVLGQRFEDMLRIGVDRGDFPDAIGREEDWIAERMRHHRDPSGPIEQRLSDGRWLRTEERRTREGGFVGLRTDITELKKTELALKENEQRFRDFAEAAADWFWEMDADLRFTYMSKNVERILGVPPEWHYGKSRADLVGVDYDRETWDEHFLTMKEHRPFRNFEYRRVGEGIESKWLRVNGIPRYDAEGNFIGYRGTAADITVQKLAEEKLRGSEEQLRQARKMEAVGQLTGGIAHDFNNLLAVIQGNAELLAARPETTASMTAPILGATARGAELIQRLLAFSRQQPLRPRTVDLGALVSGMSGLLTRALGATIEVKYNIAPDLWSALADESQVENALLNLALNARDAMPNGGALTIRCANAAVDEAAAAGISEMEVGDYVSLSVSDVGTGMSDAMRAQAFEPFFTTKEVGRGSGLGLSMVYGFAKQSGGHAIIASELGEGTTVTLYLPRGGTVAPCKDPDREPGIKAAQGETILLVEDDLDVRELVARMLDGLGYRILDARDAAAARQVLASGKLPDLMLSDVVLPGGTSGPAFALEARRRHPGLRVVFMSGYSPEAVGREGVLGSDAVLLTKPFKRSQLAKALRDALA